MLTRSANITYGTLSEVYAWANASLGEEHFTTPYSPDEARGEPYGICCLGVARTPNGSIVSSLLMHCELADPECDVAEYVFDELKLLVRGGEPTDLCDAFSHPA